MTAPDLTRTGCRVVDRDGDDWDEPAYDDGGYAEWRALDRATQLATRYPHLTPFRVTDADGVTLHTIHASQEAK